MEYYLWVKALHIIAVISWMAGMLYLPRLFVYHSAAKINSELDKQFQIMERRLLRIIMNPAMIAAIIFGVILIKYIGMSGGWLHIKLTLVLIMCGLHGFMAKCRKNFAQGIKPYSERFFRIFNEIITLLMVIIVIMATVKPF